MVPMNIVFFASDLVVQQIKDSSEGATELQLNDLDAELKKILPKVKDLALSARKSNAQTTDE